MITGLLFAARSLTSLSVYFPPPEHYSGLILFLPYEEADFLLKRITNGRFIHTDRNSTLRLETGAKIG